MVAPRRTLTTDRQEADPQRQVETIYATARDPAVPATSDAADQRLRSQQADDRACAQVAARAPRAAVRELQMLQRRRGHRGPGRGSRGRGARHPAGARGGRRTSRRSRSSIYTTSSPRRGAGISTGRSAHDPDHRASGRPVSARHNSRSPRLVRASWPTAGSGGWLLGSSEAGEETVCKRTTGQWLRSSGQWPSSSRRLGSAQAPPQIIRSWQGSGIAATGSSMSSHTARTQTDCIPAPVSSTPTKRPEGGR